MNIDPKEIVDMDLRQIMEFALHIAKGRLDLVQAAFRKSQAAEEVVAIMKRHESDVALVIAGEVGENGKPLFSNAEARAAELTKRLDTDEKYQSNKTALQSLRSYVFTNNAEADYLKEVGRIMLAYMGARGSGHVVAEAASTTNEKALF